MRALFGLTRSAFALIVVPRRRSGYSTQTQKPNHVVTLILVRLHSRRINRNSWGKKLSKAFYERLLSAIIIGRRVESDEF